MHARVAMFDGGDPDQVRDVVKEIEQQGQSGPPEGVPSVGFLLLHHEGKVIAISLFESEADLQEGDATLNSMDPPVPGGLGRRTSVEAYQVGAKFDA